MSSERWPEIIITQSGNLECRDANGKGLESEGSQPVVWFGNLTKAHLDMPPVGKSTLFKAVERTGIFNTPAPDQDTLPLDSVNTEAKQSDKNIALAIGTSVGGLYGIRLLYKTPDDMLHQEVLITDGPDKWERVDYKSRTYRKIEYEVAFSEEIRKQIKGLQSIN